MSQALDWDATATRATRMTDAELAWARRDAREAAEALDGAEGLSGKDAGYYRDEAGVYAAEQRSRG